MDLTNYKVLMVEDDNFTRSTIKAALIGKGLNIVFDTPFVKEAVEFTKKNHPDIAVLDYNLGPGPNGIDLANQLKKIHPGISIVLLTAFLDPMQLKERIAQLPPGSRYLIKHSVSDIQVLLDEIHLALNS